MDELNVFIPITKVDAVKREVWGTAAEEAPDKAKELMDYAASKPHFEAWSQAIQKASGGRSLGNVRAMHQPVAAGKVIDLQFNDADKYVFIGTHIVDDAEWKKVEAGVYTGFSVGGAYGWRKMENGVVRYEAKPSEISLVDNPCMHGATFTMVKAGGVEELRKFAEGEEDTEDDADNVDSVDKGEAAGSDDGGADNVDNSGEANAESADEKSDDNAEANEVQKTAGVSAGITYATTTTGTHYTGITGLPASGGFIIPASITQPLTKSDDPAWDAALAGYVVSDAASAVQFLSSLAGNMAGQSPLVAQRLAEAARIVGKGLTTATAQLEAATAAAQEAKTALEAVESNLDAQAQAAVDAAMTGATASEDVIEKLADAVFAKFQAVIDASSAQAQEQALAKAAGEQDTLNKRFDAVTARLGAFDDRLAKIEARPVIAGPVLREVGLGAGGAGVDAGTEMAVLAKMIEDERDPTLRQALQQKMSLLQIRAVQASGGTRISN
jgi:hypothetical protein